MPSSSAVPLAPARAPGQETLLDTPTSPHAGDVKRMLWT
jgi:hypothetical protein